MGHTQVKEWFRQLKEGRTSVRVMNVQGGPP